MTELDEDCIHGMTPTTCVLCNGRAQREAAERGRVLRWFAARYSDRCAICRVDIEPGETIGVTAGNDYVCEAHR